MHWQFEDESAPTEPFLEVYPNTKHNQKPCSFNGELRQCGINPQASKQAMLWCSRPDNSCTLESDMNSGEPLFLANETVPPLYRIDGNAQSLHVQDTEVEFTECQWFNSGKATVDGLCVEDSLCKDNVDFPENELPLHSGAKVRERRRMLSINSAFEMLRNCLPTFPYERRISKIDTLRLAIAYLALLHDMLNSLDQIPMNNSLVTGTRVIQFMFERLQAPDRHSLLWYTSDLIARLDWIRWDRLGFTGKAEWSTLDSGFQKSGTDLSGS
ncbi:Pancreas transcription factor 1 subunit alpha [Fasciola hepatica]|uniref:Pancreas transcription factor 1 subunit alpha n=1 Tax=Fasciola hepatica TaxID=6192 RepID=A0A4E0R802_FASHE|nr:Pancreas transcription factor 1 subunit alpha [Fasciola hepatica]